MMRAAALLMFLALAAGCTPPPANDDPVHIDPPTCAVEYREYVWAPEHYAIANQHDVVLVNYQAIASGKCEPDSIDCTLLAYVSAHSVNHRWQQWAPAGSFGRAWWDMGLDHLAYTTTGDTFATWTTNYVLDVSDSATVRAMVDVLRRFEVDVDGYMLDYCTAPLRSLGGDVSGEWAVRTSDLISGFCYLVDLMHETFPGRKLIVNGRLALWNESFASRIDGVWLETWDLESDIEIWKRCVFRDGGFSVFEQIEGGPESVEAAMKFDSVYGVVKRGERRELCGVEAVNE